MAILTSVVSANLIYKTNRLNSSVCHILVEFVAN